MLRRTPALLPLLAALFALYFIWGSTYFVIKIGVASWPPMMLAGLRFLLAGSVLMAFLLLRGERLPGWHRIAQQRRPSWRESMGCADDPPRLAQLGVRFGVGIAHYSAARHDGRGG